MGKRSCVYKASDAVVAAFAEADIQDMVKRTVNVAYDRNYILQAQTYAKRFQAWTVDGKVVNTGAVLKAAMERPGSLGFLLPIVCCWEEAGEDRVCVILQSEIEGRPEALAINEIRQFLDQPPNISVETLIANLDIEGLR